MKRKFAFLIWIESVQFMTIMLKELTLLSGFMTSIKPINNMFCCACAFLFSVSYFLFSDASMYKCVWRDLLINPHLLLHCKSTCFMLWKWPLKLVINHARVHLSYFELGKTNKNVFQIFCAKSENWNAAARNYLVLYFVATFCFVPLIMELFHTIFKEVTKARWWVTQKAVWVLL